MEISIIYLLKPFFLLKQFSVIQWTITPVYRTSVFSLAGGSSCLSASYVAMFKVKSKGCVRPLIPLIALLSIHLTSHFSLTIKRWIKPSALINHLTCVTIPSQLIYRFFSALWKRVGDLRSSCGHRVCCCCWEVSSNRADELNSEDKLHLWGQAQSRGKWSGCSLGWTCLPTAKVTKQSPVFRLEMGSADRDRAGRNCSAFEDLLPLLTSAFFPSFPFPT